MDNASNASNLRDGSSARARLKRALAANGSQQAQAGGLEVVARFEAGREDPGEAGSCGEAQTASATGEGLAGLLDAGFDLGV